MQNRASADELSLSPPPFFECTLVVTLPKICKLLILKRVPVITKHILFNFPWSSSYYSPYTFRTVQREL